MCYKPYMKITRRPANDDERMILLDAAEVDEAENGDIVAVYDAAGAVLYRDASRPT